MNKIVLISIFFLIEFKSIKTKIISWFSLIKNISIINLFFKLIKKEHVCIFKNKKLNEYLILNKSYWKFEKSNKKKFILLDLTLTSHPIHTIIQCILGNNFRKMTGYKCKAIIKEYDIFTKFIAKSFSINEFEILKNESFFKRLSYFIKSINIIQPSKCLKNLIFIKKDEIEIGKAAYEFTLRNYTKDLPSKNNLHLFYYALSKSLQVLEQSKKIFSSDKIAILLMAEIQFIPNRIFFQKALLKKISIYSFYGARKENQISLCCFNDEKSFNQHRMKFSKKLLNFFLKQNNFYIEKMIKKFIKLDTYKNQIGFGEKIYLEKLPKKNYLNFKNYEKFCEKFEFDKKLKTVIILPNVFIDNLLTHEWAIFDNPIEWYSKTLKIITKIKNVNWLIKPHPSEKIYNTNITAKKLFLKNISSNQKNIKFIDELDNINNLTNFISSAVSFGGSAGYEYTRLGIQVITAGDTRYSNFNLTKSPKDLREYKLILNNLNKSHRISKKRIFRAGLYWLLIKSLTRLQNHLIPITLTRSESFKENFWDLCLKNLKSERNLKINQDFYKNLLIMYKYKNRHSVDFNKIFRINKKISLKLNDIKFNN